MGRPKRTARVAIEDMFAEMEPSLRTEILNSLQRMDRALRIAEHRNAGEKESKDVNRG